MLMVEKKEINLTGQQVLQAYDIEQAKLREIEARKQQLMQLMADTAGAEQALKDLSKAAKNQKIMIALGAGIYAEAKIDDPKEVKTGLGGGILTTSTSEKALTDLAKRKEEIKKDVELMQRDEQLVMQNLNSLSTSIESMRRKTQESKK